MKCNLIARLVKSTNGTAAVEFALVATMFFMLVFGIFEGGRVFTNWLVITNEAREGARYGAVRWGEPNVDVCGAVRTQVNARATPVLDRNPVLFNVTCAASADAVTVEIDYTVRIISPLISAVWSTFPLHASSTMRSE